MLSAIMEIGKFADRTTLLFNLHRFAVIIHVLQCCFYSACLTLQHCSATQTRILLLGKFVKVFTTEVMKS